METPDKPITVMLVDDHALFRSGIRSLLQRHAEFSVVGERPMASKASSAPSSCSLTWCCWT